ncbi:MAG TPA: oxidoreductase-like domain-containing protein [Rhodanobacteraceae bacterium]
MSEQPDPRPQPPQQPLPCDCCESGCDPCVFTAYSEELEAFEAQLAAWQKRHPEPSKAD